MAHFAILSPPFAGHLIPTMMIGRRLRDKGHRVTLVSDVQASSIAKSLDVGFLPLPSSRPVAARRSLMRGIRPIERLFQLSMRQNQITAASHWLIDTPSRIARLGVDALIIEQYVTAGSSIAEFLGLPFATISASLDLREISTHPPGFTPWAYSNAWMAGLRNRLGYQSVRWFMAPIMTVINDWRSRHGLPSLRHYNEFFSPSAHIVQGCVEFDFPREPLLSRFYAGCLTCDTSRPQSSFPWDCLDDRPLVFASFGTISSKRNLPMLQMIARVCAKMPVQLVISRGNWKGDSDSSKGVTFPDRTLVFDFAPQLPLLERAALMVNHGGNNSVIEALANGVPQVICPRSADQPGVAARALRAGVALIHPFGNFSESRLRLVMEQALSEDTFRWKANHLKQSLAKTGGSLGAASFIEKTLLPG